MKKILKWTLFAVATLSLVACGTTAQKTNSQQAKTEKAAKSSASDGQVEVSLKRGQYIKPPVLNDSEDGTYLALQLEFKNVAKESINVSDSDITIYDANNNRSNCSQEFMTTVKPSNRSRVISWPRIKN